MKSRPGDVPKGMSYGEAMAVRDRHRSGQPVGAAELREANQIVDATRSRLGYSDAPAEEPNQEVEDVQDTTEKPTCVVSGVPGSMMDLTIRSMIENQQKDQSEIAPYVAYETWTPKPGSFPYLLYKFLKSYPDKKLTRHQIANGWEIAANSVDGTLQSWVDRGAFSKGTGDKGVWWGLGLNPNIIIEPWAVPKSSPTPAPTPTPKKEAAPEPVVVSPPVQQSKAQPAPMLKAPNVAISPQKVITESSRSTQEAVGPSPTSQPKKSESHISAALQELRVQEAELEDQIRKMNTKLAMVRTSIQALSKLEEL